MELRQLRAVLAIAETGSVTKAAELLHVVQPALSRQLRGIEEELGKPLFTRTRNGMALTREGRVLAEHARRALLTLEQAVTEIRPRRGVVAGLVSVGMLPSVIDLVAAPLLKRVRDAYPQIRLRLAGGYAGELQDALQDNALDLGLLYDPKTHAAIDTRPLLDEPLYLVGARTLRPRWKKSEPLSALRGLPLILPSGSHSVRGILEHACAVEDIALDIVAEADTTQLTKALLLSGIGYTVLPGVAIADEKLERHVARVPLGRPALTRRVVLACSVARQRSESVRCVEEILFTLVHDLVREGTWPGARLAEFEVDDAD